MSQPGRTFLAYGDNGGPTRYLVAKGPAHGTRYVLDISALGRATSTWPLELRWAREVGGVLYVANAHRTYASTTGNRNGYLTALDPETGRVLWQSPSLVANADGFAVVGDVIVTGYGFTARARLPVRARSAERAACSTGCRCPRGRSGSPRRTRA